MRRDKDLRRWTIHARAAGWIVERTRCGHIRWVPPDRSKPVIVTGSTPSDHRSRMNLRADLRRHGLEI